MTTEQWRPIVGFEDSYEVSDHGNVRGRSRVVGASCGKTKRLRPRPVKSHPGASGHYSLSLYRDRKGTRVGVHRLVLLAFVGEPPPNHEACHRNGDPSDNRVENLYWGTRSQNNHDKIAHGRDHNVSKTHCPVGHPYSGSNLYVRPTGNRGCRACLRKQKAAYKQRLRVAV